MSEIKNSLDELNSRLEITKESVNVKSDQENYPNEEERKLKANLPKTRKQNRSPVCSLSWWHLVNNFLQPSPTCYSEDADG